jgi:hypothetical protein
MEMHYPRFREYLAEEERQLPAYVHQEIIDSLRCGRDESLSVRCEACQLEKHVPLQCQRRGYCPNCAPWHMIETAAHLVDERIPLVPLRHWVLSVPHPLRFLYGVHPTALEESSDLLYRSIADFMIGKADLPPDDAQCGAVTLFQRCGGALNLTTRFHLLMLDGLYIKDSLVDVPLPDASDLQALSRTIRTTIETHLERRGLWVREMDQSYVDVSSLGVDIAQETLNDLKAHSITQRIAVGPNKGRKAFTLQTLPPSPEARPDWLDFSLTSNTTIAADQRIHLERRIRAITRPVLTLDRLSLTENDHIRYALKKPWHDGTTHIIFEPLDFMARLASLVPPPRESPTPLHGLFRQQLAPAQRKPPRQRFAIDIRSCERCGGPMNRPLRRTHTPVPCIS